MVSCSFQQNRKTAINVDKVLEWFVKKGKYLFQKRNHKTDKCQFLNLASHFSERSFGVVLCLVLTDILVNSIVLLQGFPLSS